MIAASYPKIAASYPMDMVKTIYKNATKYPKMAGLL
jgi:hypothetical protein